MAKPKDFESNRRKRQNRYFSESFRRQKVKEIETNMTTVSEVCRVYQVTSAAVYKWLHKYSHHRKKQVRQVVELMSDTKKILALRKRIEELEAMLGRKQIEVEFYSKMVDIASEEVGIDLKKKFGSKQSFGTGLTEKDTKEQ